VQAGQGGITNIAQQLPELLRDAMLKQRGNIDPDQLRTMLKLEAKVQRRLRQEIQELRAEVAEVRTSAQQQVASLQQQVQQAQQQLQEAQQQQGQLQQQVQELQQTLAEVVTHMPGQAARQP
jgi:chromosome segregation ATPase